MKWLLVVLVTTPFGDTKPFMQLYSMPSEKVCWEAIVRGRWSKEMTVFCTLDHDKTPAVETYAPDTRALTPER